MSDIPDEIMERAKAAHAQFADSRVKDNLTVIIYRALMAERKKALEEAAKVAEIADLQDGIDNGDAATRSAGLAATAIRKLGEG